MAENVDNLTREPASEVQTNGSSKAEPVSAANKFPHTEIRGRYDKYRSAYWGAAIATLGMRYAMRPFSRQWWEPENKSGAVYNYKDNVLKKYLYGGVAGLLMYAITILYARSTLKDIRSIFSETMAWETGKKAEDISFKDLWQSKNDIIHRTMRNYLKYNFRRSFVNIFFFVPFFPGVANFFKSKLGYSLHAESGGDWGVGANSAYLFSDVIYREETFFEGLQRFIDQKINHTDKTGDVVTTADLISLYDRHAKDKNPNYTFSGRMDTQRWKNDQRLFGRIAELMNQTYNNEPNHEQANFTVPKLIYLLGNGLIDPEHMERSLAYIETAGHNPGMDEVKQMAKALGSGMSLEEASQRGISSPAQKDVPLAGNDNPGAQPEQENKHTAKLAGETRTTARDILASASGAQSLTEKALQGNGTGAGLAAG